MEETGRHRTGAVWRRPLAALALLAVVGLAGCTGKDDPDVDPTGKGTVPSSSTTTSGTASSTGTGTATTAVPVDLPAEAKERTAAGAEAFARWYLEAYSRADVSGDSRDLKVYAAEGCTGCASLAKIIDERTAKSQHVKEETLALGLSRIEGGSPESKIDVAVLADEGEKSVVDDAGKEVFRIRAAKLSFITTAIWGSSSWQMQRIERR